jgi:hypothetical protein
MRVLAIAGVALLVALSTATALGQGNPLNDLFAIGLGEGDDPAAAPIERREEPPLAPAPRAQCGPGSRPEPGVQGRVPEGSNKDGFTCNTELVGHQGTEGGFKTLRYVDAQGHECAFYDTTLLFPTNAANVGGGSHGVAVLDMSDPANPKKTAGLEAPPMQSPHESLALNTRRGLLAAVNGNPSTSPGLVAIYDVSKDCRQPEMQSLAPVARWGHESGFSEDGRTFYATSTAFQSITAVDVTDPKSPHALSHIQVTSHGMSLSDDGNRGYIADPQGNMLILDTSEIQARKPEPKTREISRLTWDKASIPQNAIPFTSGGKPYVLEFDEYTQAVFDPSGDQDAVGAARIIDVSDETKPRSVANLRLEINQPAEHKAAREAGDPGTSSPAQGYAAHYCNIPTRVDPKIVACSFIASGLRVFDISDLLHPREIAYYVAPPKPDTQNGYDGSNYAMSQPAIVPERREIWYTDGSSGFNVVRVADGVWPKSNASGGACTARTPSRHARVRKGARISARARLMSGGKPVAGAPVKLRAPGVTKTVRTDRKGYATFRFRSKRKGHVTVSTAVCGAQLALRAKRLR